jgi:hypothetical protein
MPVLPKSRHEQFAQFVAKGLSATQAYISAGYAERGAAQNASRLIKNYKVSRRIDELKEKISDGVVRLEIRERSVRLQILQSSVDGMRQVMAARALEYADQPGGSSGLLVKDYRGLKFDAALMSQLNATLKQAAIEEGQWSEKRDLTGSLSIEEGYALLTAGRDRLAAEKKAALERGEEWS